MLFRTRTSGSGYILLIVIALVLLPFTLIIGIPLVTVGLKNRESLFFNIPVCPSTPSADFTPWISQNLSNGQSCSLGISTSNASSFQFTVNKIRSDVDIALFIARPDIAKSTGSISFSIFDDGELIINNATFTLSQPPPLSLSSRKYVTDYGDSYGEFKKSGSDVKAFGFDYSDSDCKDEKKGCSVEIEQTLMRDRMLNTKFTAKGTVVIVIHSLVVNLPTYVNGEVQVFVGVATTKLSSLAIGGIIVLLLPVLIACSPCLYCLTLFRRR